MCVPQRASSRAVRPTPPRDVTQLCNNPAPTPAPAPPRPLSHTGGMSIGLRAHALGAAPSDTQQGIIPSSVNPMEPDRDKLACGCVSPPSEPSRAARADFALLAPERAFQIVNPRPAGFMTHHPARRHAPPTTTLSSFCARLAANSRLAAEARQRGLIRRLPLPPPPRRLRGRHPRPPPLLHSPPPRPLAATAAS